jgi:hypothetical protein
MLCLGICLEIQWRITRKPVRIADKSTEIRTGQLAATCSAGVNYDRTSSIESGYDTHRTRGTASLDSHSVRMSQRTYAVVWHFTRSAESSRKTVNTETQSLITHINNSTTDNESAMSARWTHFNYINKLVLLCLLEAVFESRNWIFVTAWHAHCTLHPSHFTGSCIWNAGTKIKPKLSETFLDITWAFLVYSL